MPPVHLDHRAMKEFFRRASEGGYAMATWSPAANGRDGEMGRICRWNMRGAVTNSLGCIIQNIFDSSVSGEFDPENAVLKVTRDCPLPGFGDPEPPLHFVFLKVARQDYGLAGLE